MRKHQIIRASLFGRHTHRNSYAAVVLAGSYEEAGDQGRFQVVAGDVVLHEAYEAHLNRFPGSEVVVLNLPLQKGMQFRSGLSKLSNPDAVVRAAEKDTCEAVQMLLCSSEQSASCAADWPDLLASDLLLDPDLRLGRWAATHGISSWELSRGFLRVFGITAEAYRLRIRARKALNAIQTTSDTLAAIAASHGFSDQSHMTRSVKQLTGYGPRFLRLANGFNTETVQTL